MKKIRVIVKHPGERVGHIMEIDNELHAMQEIVGGNIEPVRWGNFIILCNEEGKLKDLPTNFYFFHDRICGTVFVCVVDGEEFTDCPLDLLGWEKMLYYFGNEEVKEWHYQ